MIMWTMQIFLAVAFGAAGTMKVVRSKAQLAANPHMGWVHSVPEDRIKLLGGAAATHTMRGESAAVSTILAVLMFAVATIR